MYIQFKGVFMDVGGGDNKGQKMRIRFQKLAKYLKKNLNKDDK